LDQWIACGVFTNLTRQIAFANHGPGDRHEAGSGDIHAWLPRTALTSGDSPSALVLNVARGA
jgi:hypothetical protein